MSSKYVWTEADIVSSQVLTKLIDDAGFSLRTIEEKTGGEITYSRIYDIRSQRRTPVRLSEFIELCLVCGADPSEVLRKVKTEVDRRKQGKDIDETSLEEKTMQTLAKIGKPEYGLAAHQSSRKLDPEAYD